MALVDEGDRRRHCRPDQECQEDDMTGIANKAGKKRCNNCHAPDHGIDWCPYKNTSAVELKLLRKKHAASPQLLHVGEESGGESDVDVSLGDLEGVTLVSPAISRFA